MTYYVRYRGRVDGPYTMPYLREMIAAGKLTLSAEVADAAEGRGEGWFSISELLSGSEKPVTAGNDSSRAQAKDHSVLDRYRDAYRVGAALVLLGSVIKSIGAIAGTVTLIASLSSNSADFGRAAAIAGMVVAICIAGLAWVAGVIVSAQGQILRATLDSAVGSSPFLTNEERLDAMGLPKAVAKRVAS